MPYYETIEQDLKRAREILARGKGEPNDLPIHEHVHFDGGMIYGGDIFAAYKLLESFVAHITTHFRPDHNGECLNCDETEDGHDVLSQLANLEAEVKQLHADYTETVRLYRERAAQAAQLHDRLYHEGIEHSECQAALLKAQAEVVDLQRWKDAISDACITDWIFTREHDTNPRLAVADLLAWQQQITLDPTVSKEAAELHERIAYLGTRVDLAEGLNRQHEQTIAELQAESAEKTNRNVGLIAEVMRFYGLFSDYEEPCVSFEQAQAIWNEWKRRLAIEQDEVARLRALVDGGCVGKGRHTWPQEPFVDNPDCLCVCRTIRWADRMTHQP